MFILAQESGLNNTLFIFYTNMTQLHKGTVDVISKEGGKTFYLLDQPWNILLQSSYALLGYNHSNGLFSHHSQTSIEAACAHLLQC